jgi:hypothetical protein
VTVGVNAVSSQAFDSGYGQVQASERVSVTNLRGKLTEFAQARQEFTRSLEVRDADEK